MIINARNSFERHGRFRKLEALVAVIDRACRERRRALDPIREGERVAAILEGWPDENWAKAALCAAVRPPSSTTRAAVVAYYRERAMRRAG
jgi:hypothetical protein